MLGSVQVLRERLLTEAECSVRLNAEVASRWGYLFRLEVPQELHQEMLTQQAACDTIIASKDAVVAAMRSQLHDKDDEYVSMLKQQGEDVDSLLLNMGKQLEEMQTAYRDELAQIDDAYLQVSSQSKALSSQGCLSLLQQFWCSCRPCSSHIQYHMCGTCTELYAHAAFQETFGCQKGLE